MKFVCDSCGMRYHISDELVRGKIVKIRCKRCSTILEAHLPAPEDDIEIEVTEEDLEPREDQAPAGAAADAAAGERPPRKKHPTSQPPPLPPKQWFMALDGAPVGPLSLAEVRATMQRGEAGAEDLVWRPGLGMWQPIIMVDALRRFLTEGMAPPAGPPALPGSQAMPAPGFQGSGAWQMGAAAAPPEVPLAPQVQGTGAWQVGPRALPGEIGAPAQLQGSGVWVLPRQTRVTEQAWAPGLVPPGAPMQQAQTPAPRWPLISVVLGGVLLLLASAVFLIVRNTSGRDGFGEGDSINRRVSDRAPLQGLYVEPERPHQILTDEPPPIEVQRQPTRQPARRTPTRPRVSAPPDAGLTLAQKLGAKQNDLSAVLASKVMRLNRSTLQACDRLAERRGELLTNGRAVFKIKVDHKGKAQITVKGERLSERVVSCYRSVSRSWSIPKTGHAYSTSFWHVH